MSAFARRLPGSRWTTGNDRLACTVARGSGGTTVVERLESRLGRTLDWASGAPFAPVVEADSVRGLEPVGIDVQECRLEVRYRSAVGLKVCHCLEAAPDLPVLVSWTILENRGSRSLEGIRRFDALSLALGVSGAEPLATYLLGWLFGPRLDAPGRPAVPFAYPSWIPGLLYGRGARIDARAPEGGWFSPLLRPIVGERLTQLPLRSGARSTFEDFPWACVRDPARDAGFFAGFTWSGTWAMDLEHRPADRRVSVVARTDGCVHALAPGARLESPRAFVGFFEGDWDEGSNATRRWVSAGVLPPMDRQPPLVSSGIAAHGPSGWENGRFMWKEEVDAAAEAGIEDWSIDAGWWADRYEGTDFSLGLGCFEGNPDQYPEGLRKVSDHVHSRGMKFGLWFEIERVDIRTAGRGRVPWQPGWLVHHDGVPHRSWCQHVFSLCLGVRAAQDWAIENLTWAIREYRLDLVLIDSNEWSVCDDPSHGHGPGDGEWAQIQGLHRVLATLRERFPGLLISNLGGGSQRSDFGMARFTHRMCPADVICPSQVNRKYAYGIGFVLPEGYSGDCVADCPADAAARLSREELTWRCANAMGGAYSVLFRMRHLDCEAREVVTRSIAFFKRIRPTLWGDRYVLVAPPPFVELADRQAGHREGAAWEAYQRVSVGRNQVSLFAYRCLDPEADRTFVLRGLDPSATYAVASYRGGDGDARTGASLMGEGVRIVTDHPRTAEILLFTRT